MNKIRKDKPTGRKARREITGDEDQTASNQKKLGIRDYLSRKPKGSQQKRDKNQYHFEGFYERLKALDVKQSHTVQAAHGIDTLLDFNSRQEMEDQLKSNFIVFLRTEKMNNRTLDFANMYRRVEPLAQSQALVVLNQRKILLRLLKSLSPESTLAEKSIALDLLIALIKDLREDVYESFKSLILPKSLEVIDTQELSLLDKVFSMVSFGIKYLVKPITKDFRVFYSIYIELLVHKSKHLRKFAAQALSYVLRKMINQFSQRQKNDDSEEENEARQAQLSSEVFNLLCQPLEERSEQHLPYGISDLLFEIIYGAAQDINSNSGLVLSFLLSEDCKYRECSQFQLMTRILFIKLFNEIDTSKQLPIYEQIDRAAKAGDRSQLRQSLLFLQDAVKLKFGSRVSQLCLIQALETMNSLLSGNYDFDGEMQELVAETLSLLYYFKYLAIKQVFSTSKLEIATSKNVFSYGVYKKCPQSLATFFQIFLEDPACIQVHPKYIDLDYGSILGLKQNKQKHMEFTVESHASKLRALLPKFDSHVQQEIAKNSCDAFVLIALLNMLIAVEQKYKINLREPAQRSIISILKAQNQSKGHETRRKLLVFNLLRLISNSEASSIQSELRETVERTQLPKKYERPNIDEQASFKEIVSNNYVLQAYQDVSIKHFTQTYMDLRNHGQCPASSIAYQSYVLAAALKQEEETELLVQSLVDDPQNVLALRCLLKASKKNSEKLIFSLQEHRPLFDALARNLAANSRTIRLLSLNLLRRFKPLNFVSGKEEVEQYSAKSPCNCLELMYEFEKAEIGFETERTKQAQLERLEVMAKYAVLPSEYCKATYYFLVGCLWVKFTPLFPAVHLAVAALINNSSAEMKEFLVREHSLILRGAIWLSQINPKEEKKLLCEALLVCEGQPLELPESDDQALLKAYQRETRLDEDSLDINDFLFQVCKAVEGALQQSILSNLGLRTLFFGVFDSFVKHEYLRFKNLDSSLLPENADDQQIIARMSKANQVETEAVKKHRHQSFATLSSFLELFRHASSLKMVPNVSELQRILIKLLAASEVKTQRLALDCLIKSGYHKALLLKYQKLLDGFIDDEKFKNMIPILEHGSQDQLVQQVGEQDFVIEEEIASKVQRKETKSVIPKLDKEDRGVILPLIVKILQSKVHHKKGAINQKSIHARRTLVYQFFATLDPNREFQIVVDQLLEPVGLSSEEVSNQVIQSTLSAISLNQQLTFVNQLEIMVKQMGVLLRAAIPYLSTILISGVIKLVKVFLQGDTNEQELAEDELEQPVGDEEEGQAQLHFNARKQAKNCLRKSLNLVNEIYKRYSDQVPFIGAFSDSLFSVLIEEELPHLCAKYSQSSSQFLLILCQSWPASATTISNLERPGVMRSLSELLQHPTLSYDVASILFGLLTKLIGETKPASAKDDQLMSVSGSQTELMQKQASQLLAGQAELISEALLAFWGHRGQELKRIMTKKGRDRPVRIDDRAANLKAAQIRQRQQQKYVIAKDFLFVISEMSTYLSSSSMVTGKLLEVIVQIMGIRAIHEGSQDQSDLLLFGVNCIINLIPRVPNKLMTSEFSDKILQMFLRMQNPRVRSQLAGGLLEAFPKSSSVGSETLTAICELNTLKRGVADLELDCDKAIAAIQSLMGGNSLAELEIHSLKALVYSVVFFCQHEEYSLREYATHFIDRILEVCRKRVNSEAEEVASLVNLLEQLYIQDFLRTVKDELVLKSVLMGVRSLVLFCHDTKINDALGLSLFHCLSSPDSEQDFFQTLFSIRLKQRQRCLTNLATKVTKGEFSSSIRSFERVILPFLDYITLAGAHQLQNKRHTISYDQQHKRELLDSAFSVYRAFASQLRSGDYFRCLKRYLYKLKRAEKGVRTAKMTAAEPELQAEKVVTKVICHFLNGLSFERFPDAIDAIAAERNRQAQTGSAENTLCFEKLLIANGSEEDPDAEDSDSEDSSSSDTGEEASRKEEQGQADADGDILMRDINHDLADENSPEEIEKVQKRIERQVLPIIERHLSEEGAGKREENSNDRHFRSFAVVCYAKAIRKLPVASFERHFRRLINMLVVNGLRARELPYREKARKAILKLVQEVSPLFLENLFEEMRNQLTRGYQQHVYLYSMHNLLSSLLAQGSLDTKSIGVDVVKNNMDVLLSELFGELNDEKANDQENQRRLIKEAKARKAMPIFEIFAQIVDFEQGFMIMLAPIVRVLQESPSVAKIQQCEELLGRVSGALLKNQTVEGPQLLTCLYSIISSGVKMATRIKINDEKQQRDYGATAEELAAKEGKRKTLEDYRMASFKVEMYWHKGNQTVDKKTTEEISGRVLATFGLQCLKKALKHKHVIRAGGVDVENLRIEERNSKDLQILKDRLDPFVEILLNSFKTYHNPIIVTSLAIVTQIVGLGLPSFGQHLKKFLNRIFKLFQQSQATDSDFTNSLFKCISELIKNYTTNQDLSEYQMKTLIEMIKDCIDKLKVQGNALQCLRSVVHRRFVCSELYDLMETVQDMMVSSVDKLTRQLCQSIFQQFLLDYPLENQRIEQHINFLLKNLSFRLESGRIQILSTLKVLFQKFPGKILEVYCELFFFSLLLRTVNDESQECREQVSATLATLVQSFTDSKRSLSASKLKSIYNSLMKMSRSPDSESTAKRDQLLLAKLSGLQTLLGVQDQNQTRAASDDGGSVITSANILSLSRSDVSEILSQCCTLIVEPEHQVLQKRVDQVLVGLKRSRNQDSDQEQQSDDEETQRFLRAIELQDDDEGEVAGTLEEAKASERSNYSILFIGLQTIERLARLEWAQKMGAVKFMSQLGIAKTLHLFARYHPVHWIRLISQRIMGHLFCLSERYGNSQKKMQLHELLGLDIPEQVQQFTLDLVESLRKPMPEPELRSCFVKNLAFLVKFLMTSGDPNIQAELKLDRIFAKVSFIGRKLMLDIKTSADRLDAIVQFFKESVGIFKQVHPDIGQVSGEKAESIRKAIEHVVNLTLRLTTDQQYAKFESIRETSSAVQESLQAYMTTSEYLQMYSGVQKSIQRRRAERKERDKRLVTTEDGLKMRQRKRERKLEKKRQKKVNKIIESKLR